MRDAVRTRNRFGPAGRVEGSGLGLFLSHKLAGLIEGWIEFQSEFGKGSRFTLVIPTWRSR